MHFNSSFEKWAAQARTEGPPPDNPYIDKKAASAYLLLAR